MATKRAAAGVVALLLLLLSLASAPRAAAEELWNEDYFRALDAEGILSDYQQTDLDRICLDFVRTFGVDLALYAAPSEKFDGDMDGYAASYWASGCFGYGEGRDGFLVLYETDTGVMRIVTFGAASERVDADYLAFVENSSPKLYTEHGLYGVLYGAQRYLRARLEDEQSGGKASAEAAPDSPAQARPRADGLPDWYPADPANFTFFHDENAPRVVDNADLIPDREEAAMEQRLAALRTSLRRDIVVYTDVSSYGLGRDVWAADFYDFNGYGIGDEREGACLFICMETGNRGFWTCCTGPETRALFTEATANELDDVLYEYMVSGDYAEGISDWIGNFATLYQKGLPFVPDWYPDLGESLEAHHDAQAPRVVDEAGALSGDELARIQKEAAGLADSWGVDVAVRVVRSPGSLSPQEYSDACYRAMGYGFGDGYDGALLSVFTSGGYDSRCAMTVSGTGAQRMSDTMRGRMLDYCADRLTDSAAEGVEGWLSDLSHLYKTGRVQRSAFYWNAMTVLGSLLGLLGGGVSLAFAKSRMGTPTVRQDANSYVVRNAVSVRDAGDVYLNTTTSRSYSPRQTRSSGGGGGSSSGRSSYSSSYRGSSGSSHSGSGRSF